MTDGFGTAISVGDRLVSAMQENYAVVVERVGVVETRNVYGYPKQENGVLLRWESGRAPVDRDMMMDSTTTLSMRRMKESYWRKVL